MNYTLAELLRTSAIEGIKLLTERKDFDQIFIESVSVQELPVEGFIRKNELVLSTAVGCQENESRFFTLIQEVGRAQPAALLLAFRDEQYEVPQSVLDYANKIELALFSIPWEQRFSDIQFSIIQKIENKKLFVYRELQTSLFNAFFDSASLPDAVKLIDKAFQAPVLITDENQCLLVSSRALQEEEYPPDQAEAEIFLNDAVVGRLCILGSGMLAETAPGIADVNMRLKKYICFPLSLWFNRKNIEDMMVVRLKNDFIWNLATQNYDSLADMAQQGTRLHFNLDCPYTCLVLKAVPQGEGHDTAAYSAASVHASSQIENILIQTAKDFRLRVMAAARSLDFIVFLENHCSLPVENIDRYIDGAERKFKSACPEYVFYWWISEITLKPPTFHMLYQNASIALQYCLTASRKQYRFTYRDTKELQIISALSRSDTVRKIADETIRSLREYDVSAGINMMETLTTFIRCNYNISLTARTLHIHRQSLLYRLKKIEQLTDMSLSNHQDLFLLEICTHLYYHY